MLDILTRWFSEDRIAYALASLVITLTVGVLLTVLLHSLGKLLNGLLSRE